MKWCQYGPADAVWCSGVGTFAKGRVPTLVAVGRMEALTRQSLSFLHVRQTPGFHETDNCIYTYNNPRVHVPWSRMLEASTCTV